MRTFERESKYNSFAVIGFFIVIICSLVSIRIFMSYADADISNWHIYGLLLVFSLIGMFMSMIGLGYIAFLRGKCEMIKTYDLSIGLELKLLESKSHPNEESLSILYVVPSNTGREVGFYLETAQKADFQRNDLIIVTLDQNERKILKKIVI